MKKPLSKFFTAFALLCTCGFIGLSQYSLRADDGGGSGDPATPYGLKVDVSTSEIEAVHVQADRHVRAEWGKGENSERCPNVGFAYLRSSSAAIQPAYILQGLSATGKKVAVRLSTVSSITIKKYAPNKKRVLVEIDQFPAITPQDLIKIAPTWEKLKLNYRKHPQLWLDIVDSRGSTLALVGNKGFRDSSSTPEIVKLSLGKMSVGDSILFQLDPQFLWWAIPSVAHSSGYPYKKPAKAS